MEGLAIIGHAGMDEARRGSLGGGAAFEHRQAVGGGGSRHPADVTITHHGKGTARIDETRGALPSGVSCRLGRDITRTLDYISESGRAGTPWDLGCPWLVLPAVVVGERRPATNSV